MTIPRPAAVVVGALAVAAALHIAAPWLWAFLATPDPAFGWGPHALCLHGSPIVPVLVVAGIGVAGEYARIPLLLRRLRAAGLGDGSPTAQRTIARFAWFILACGAGHALRVVVLFVPTLTPLLAAVDLATLGVSTHVRHAVEAAVVELRALRAERDRLHDESATLRGELAEHEARRIATQARLDDALSRLREMQGG